MASDELLERDDALRTVSRALEGAAAGRGAVALVSGEAGVGKSAVLDASVPIAEGLGMWVLRARASQLDRRFGFGVIRQLLDPALGRLEGRERERAFAGAASGAVVLFDGASSPDMPEEPEFAVLNGLLHLVSNLSETRPLVLSVDDVQWADVPTVRALEFLARRIDSLPVAVLATERNAVAAEPSGELDAIRADPQTVRVGLRPLSRESADRIVSEAVTGKPDRDFLDTAWQVVGGNPLLLDLARREIVANGLRGERAEADRLTGLIAPGLAPIVLGRLRSLGPETGRLAVAAAVLEDRIRFDDLTALAGLQPAAARNGLNRLADAGILTRGGTRFVHELVKAAVLAARPASDLDRLHRMAALRLRARNAPAGEIAVHRFAATPAGDAEAVLDLQRAAREARRQGAISVAIDLLRRGLDEGAGPPELRRELLIDLGELELRALTPECVARMREALALGASGEEEARARAVLGQVLILSDPPAALNEITAARATPRGRGADLRLEAAELECLLFIDGMGERREERYREIAAAPSLSAVGLAHRAIHEALTGEPAERVVATAEEALRDESLVDRIGPGGPTWNLLAHSLRWAEAAGMAWQMILRGDEAVHQGGLHAAGAFVEQARVYWHLELGSAAQALSHAEAGIEAARGSGLAISEAALNAALAESLVLLGRPAEAAERAEAELDIARGTVVEPFCLAARGAVRAATGRTDAAEDDLRLAVEQGESRGWRSPRITWARLRLAALLAAAGDREQALEVIAPDVEAAARIGAPGTLGAVLRVRAMALEGEQRLESLSEAAALLARSPLVHELARARLDLGREQLTRGRLDEARELLRDGLDGASRADSAALVGELRAALADAGGRPRRERRRGPEALTPTERRTAELAAEGLSNREIAETLWVTRKTVEFHLRNAYGKLGIKSRTDLPEALGTAQTLG